MKYGGEECPQYFFHQAEFSPSYLYAITGYYSLIERSDVVGHADAQAVVIARSDKKLLAQEKVLTLSSRFEYR